MAGNPMSDDQPPNGDGNGNVDADVEAELRRRTRRAFVVGGVAALLGYGGLRWLARNPAGEVIPPSLRRILRFDEMVARATFGKSRLSRVYPKSDARMPRKNGTLGLDAPVASWRLAVDGKGVTAPLSLSLDELQTLPRAEVSTELRCVEGWSEVVWWAGTRFSDFVARYVDASAAASEYVGLRTPDGKYYVGLDLASMLHPQTLLCWEMNGAPLTDGHGAPLRLVVPVKYGIKSLKRLGGIHFTDERPADYWAEKGYDYYAGF